MFHLETGRFFFFNEITKESVWTLPRRDVQDNAGEFTERNSPFDSVGLSGSTYNFVEHSFDSSRGQCPTFHQVW